MSESVARSIQSAVRRQIIMDNVTYLNFAGSYYLDLAGHPDVVAATALSASQYGLGSDLGYSTFGEPIYNIECYGAQFFNAEATLYCSSAFNGVLIACEHLSPRCKAAFVDENCHYSIQMGTKLFDYEVHQFKHCDADDLHRKIKDVGATKFAILTDGVFPTWGNIAPLDKYSELLAEFPTGHLVVDDAHGLGMLGQRGAGALEYAGVSWMPRIYNVAGLSKGVGVQGALLSLTADELNEIKGSNTVYNSISLPVMPTVSAALCALKLCKDPGLRQQIKERKNQFIDGLRKLGINVHDQPTSIVTFSLGSKSRNTAMFEHLIARKIWVVLSNYVGAPAEGAIRTTIMPSHTAEDVDLILQEIAVAVQTSLIEA